MAGRPTKYKADYAEQARKLCLLGFTDVELAAFFEVAESTLNLWKKKHKGFSESLKGGKAVADAEVAQKLFERATGYVTREERVLDGRAITLEKEFPPDPTSMIFWLKNRQPNMWRDRVPDGAGLVLETPASIQVTVTDGRAAGG